MDDEDFDDLLAGVDLLEDSSQEFLTEAAANLSIPESTPCDRSPYSPSSLSDSSSHFHLEQTSLFLSGLTRSFSSCDADQLVARPEQPHSLVPSDVELMNTTDDSAPTESRTLDHDSLSVLRKIEKIFEDIDNDLCFKKTDLCVMLKTRKQAASAIVTGPTGTSAEAMSALAKERRICFPGKTAMEAWRFTLVIRILELIHEALNKDMVLSKRDIYYRDPALFGSQVHVDRYVDDIAFTFDVPRSALNIIAAAKGLFLGSLRICNRDGSVISSANDKEGFLVPNLKDVLSVDMTAVKWILVVEKEASFRSIAASTFWTEVSSVGVLITGKGYPDIATRAFLHFLSTPSPQNGFASPPVFCLVDFDPDGLAILSTYKNGSMALAHENQELRVPQLRWLGLRLEHANISGDDVHASQGLMRLTQRDRRKAIKMLDRNSALGDEREHVQTSHALQMMLMLNMKAELQLLDARPNGMVELLKSELDVRRGQGVQIRSPKFRYL